MATLTVYPDANPESTTVDGNVSQAYSAGTGQSWSTIRGLTDGNTVADDQAINNLIQIKADTGSNTYQTLTRSFFLFDTSPITAYAVVTAATLSLYGYNQDNALGASATVAIVSSSPASDTGLANADFDQVGSTDFATRVAYADFNIGSYEDFALNAAGIANISGSGISKFGVREGAYDLDNTTPPWVSASRVSINIYWADETGTTSDPKLVVTYRLGFANPANAYSSNDSYATVPATTGQIEVYLSKNGGSSYTSAYSNTYTGTEATQVYGGATDLWGTTWVGTDVNDTNFRVKIICGGSATYYMVYKTFGFSISASRSLVGIEVDIEAKWNSGTEITSIDHVKVKVYYGGETPITVQAGSVAYATDGRKNGEGAGVGTGVQVFYDSQDLWIASDTGTEVQA